jgi:ABC-type multidrug transport system ATPase subunit
MIKVEKLCKSYNDQLAVDHVSFDVPRGELFGLIGPDGAGKSTLIRMLMTLILPDDGSAMMSDYEIQKDYKEIRKIVGYMPGRFSLYQDLSVRENLEFFATVFGTSIEENYYLIKDIYSHIEPFKDGLAGKLSGGMKQKLALSCALIHKPEILVLDEPTTGVDAVSRKEFWEMLKRLQDYGITILVSTPYMDEAMLCDRVALMQDGKFLDIDTPSKIIEKHKRKTFGITGKNKFDLIQILRTWEMTDSVYAFGEYLHFTSINDQISKDELSEYLKNKGCSEFEIVMIEAGIEDVFMGLMKE